MRRSRGTLLITALFIAVFLFFLSAALVATNRQDIKFSLTANQRLQAEMASYAGANFAIQTMKTNPTWEAALQGAHGRLASDATWSVVVSPFPDPGGTNYLQEVKATGVMGGASATQDTVVEEFRMAPSVPTDQEAMVFAATTDGQLALLDRTFQWQVLGALPNPTAWLAAQGGPLFTQAATGSAAPPPVFDWQPTYGPFNVLVPGNITRVSLPQTANDEHILYLTFQGGQGSFQDVPDPTLIDNQMYRLDNTPGGSIRMATAVGLNQSVTYAASDFKGPMVDWYGLRGPAMAANGSVIYCHAVHYFYTGIHFQNHVGVVRGVIVSNPVLQQAQLLSEPAVLSYDLSSKKWSRVVDCMVIPEGAYQLPLPYSGPQPDMGSLGLVGKAVYALQAGAIRQLLEGQPTAWKASQTVPGLSKGLYTYNNQLLVHSPNSPSPDGLPQVSLGTLTPETDLSFSEPSAKGDVLDPITQTKFVPRIVRPIQSLHFTTLADVGATSTFTTRSMGADCVATVGTDLYTFCRTRFSDTQEQGIYLPPYDKNFFPRAPVDTLGIAHFDGSHWQIWPGGSYQQTLVQPAGNTVAIETSGGAPVQLSNEFLAVGLYGKADPAMRRYTPVVKNR